MNCRDSCERAAERCGNAPHQVQPGTFSFLRQGSKTPRGPGGALLLYMRRQCTVGRSPWGEPKERKVLSVLPSQAYFSVFWNQGYFDRVCYSPPPRRWHKVMMRIWRMSVWRRLASVTYIRLEWRVLAHRARLSRPGSRLPLRSSVARAGSRK